MCVCVRVSERLAKRGRMGIKAKAQDNQRCSKSPTRLSETHGYKIIITSIFMPSSATEVCGKASGTSYEPLIM